MAPFVRRPEVGAFAALLIVYAFFAIVTKPSFLSLAGTASWVDTASQLGVLAVPVGLLMIAGEFDLSVGSMVAAGAMIVGVGSNFYSLPIWLSIVIALAFGALVGLFNGFVTTRTGLPSFIVTIGTMFVVEGLTLGLTQALTNSSAVTISTTGAARKLFGSSWGQFDVSIVWCVAITAVAFFVLESTKFGNWIFATGGNRTAARSAGVKTAQVKTLLFVVTSMSAIILGILQAFIYAVADTNYGTSYVFDAPVAAVIGGILLWGGFGSAIGAFIGSALFGIVDLGIFYTGWNTNWASLFIGVVLLGAVLANNYIRQAALRQ